MQQRRVAPQVFDTPLSGSDQDTARAGDSEAAPGPPQLIAGAARGRLPPG